MNIPDEVVYGAIGALYVAHATFQKRQFKRLEASADECEEDRAELRDIAFDQGKKISSLDTAVKLLATPCTTPGCQRNNLIDEATGLQGVTPAKPRR
jgi:hypothetical protein